MAHTLSTCAPDDQAIELRIPASSQWVRVARLTVAGVASRLPFSVDAVEDIKLAVTEAINNSIQHAPLETINGQAPHIPTDGAVAGDAVAGSVGSEERARPSVRIQIQATSEGLWVSVMDEGRLETSLEAPGASPAYHSGDALPENGMGLMLIESLMDEVCHQSGRQSDTVVRMFKRLPRCAS